MNTRSGTGRNSPHNAPAQMPVEARLPYAIQTGNGPRRTSDIDAIKAGHAAVMQSFLRVADRYDWRDRLNAERYAIDQDLFHGRSVNIAEEFDGRIVQGPLREAHALLLTEYIEFALERSLGAAAVATS